MPRKPESAEEVLETPFATVFPVDGTYLAGVPAVPMIAGDELAARLVRTGAFRYEAPEIPDDGEAPLIEVIAAPEGVAEALDFYDPPPVAEPSQPDGPAEDAGPSDSQEA